MHWPMKHMNFLYEYKYGTIETQGRAGIGVYSTALSTGLTTI
jgi:hypothetical protein